MGSSAAHAFSPVPAASDSPAGSRPTTTYHYIEEWTSAERTEGLTGGGVWVTYRAACVYV